MNIPSQRLVRQFISKQSLSRPADVVAWFGAMQAQDYLASLWALGLRVPAAVESTIESAIADGSVIRTHVFRGTWQYVAREDLRWMLELVGERVIAMAGSRFRQLELDPRTLKRCGELLAKALRGGNQLTRVELGKVLTAGRIPSVSPRLLHILQHAELDGVICSGGRRGRQNTFALLDERVPRSRQLGREEAMIRLAVRYFQSRGPATERDFAWWTGLTLSDARLAVTLAGTRLESRIIGDQRYWSAGGPASPARKPSAHLLPAFDEYLVGYADRSAVSDIKHLGRINAGGGILNPVAVLDGQVVGTWRRVLGRGVVRVAVRPFHALSPRDQGRLREAASRYGKFLRLEARVKFSR